MERGVAVAKVDLEVLEEKVSNDQLLDPTARFALLIQNVDAREVAGCLAIDLLTRLPAARAAVAEAIRDANLKHPKAVYEAKVALEGLSAIERALTEQADPKKRPRDDSSLGFLIGPVLQDAAYGVLEDQRALKQEWSELCDRMDRHLTKRALRVMPQLRKAMADVGQERGEILRDVRATCQEIVESEQGAVLPIAWLMLAAVNFMLGFFSAETERHLRHAMEISGGGSSLAAGLSARFLARLPNDEDAEPAYQAAIQATQPRKDPESLLDAAIWAARVERMDQAQAISQALFMASPVYIIPLMAEKALKPVRIRMLEQWLQTQDAARTLVVDLMGQWSARIAKVRAIESQAGVPIPLPAPLEEGRKRLADGLGDSDLFRCLGLRSRIETALEEVAEFAERAVHAEHEILLSRVDAARAGLDAAWAAREAEVKNAMEVQNLAVEKSRHALRNAFNETEKAQQSCTLGLSMGCGTFCVYLAAAAFMGWRGIEIGPTTPVGIIFFAIAGIPFILGLIAMLAAGLRRAALDAELHEKVREAQRVYEKAAAHADKLYQDRIAAFREKLTESESDLQRTSEALRLLRSLTESPG